MQQDHQAHSASNENSNYIVMDRDFLSRKIDPAQVDKHLANELTKLSYDERRRITEEIHGVSSRAVQETPDLVDRSLKEFQLEIGRQLASARAPAAGAAAAAADPSNNVGYGYRRAVQTYRQSSQSVGYLEQPAVRIKFLRHEFYDIPKSVGRYLRYCDMMLDYYGIDGLTRPLEFNDLTKDERAFIQRGGLQILPSRDRGKGRRVLSILPFFTEQNETSNTTEMYCRPRIILYMDTIISNDVCTQRHGAALIVWCSMAFAKSAFLDTRQEFIRVQEATVLRYSAIHLCVMRFPLSDFLRAMIAMSVPRSSRNVLRFHVGSQTEIEYALMSFGLPVTDLPVTSTGAIKLSQQKSFIRIQRQIDSIRNRNEERVRPSHMPALVIGPVEKDTGIIECPLLKDVLFQHGGRSAKHPGNIAFTALIESILPEFQNERRSSERKAVIDKLISTVQNEFDPSDTRYAMEQPRRFLLWDKSHKAWLDVTNDRDVLREKIRILIRDHITRLQLRSAPSTGSTTATSTASETSSLTSAKKLGGKIARSSSSSLQDNEEQEEQQQPMQPPKHQLQQQESASSGSTRPRDDLIDNYDKNDDADKKKRQKIVVADTGSTTARKGGDDGVWDARAKRDGSCGGFCR